jgi:hypothetical protein
MKCKRAHEVAVDELVLTVHLCADVDGRADDARQVAGRAERLVQVALHVEPILHVHVDRLGEFDGIRCIEERREDDARGCAFELWDGLGRKDYVVVRLVAGGLDGRENWWRSRGMGVQPMNTGYKPRWGRQAKCSPYFSL